MTEKSETVNFPVTQSILPWTFNFNAFGAAAPMTVALGTSRDARLERAIVDAAGSYGRQLGRLGEALGVVLDDLDRLRASGHLPELDKRSRKAIKAFRAQLETVQGIKAMNRSD